MLERANLMRSKLTVWTAPDSGTKIELTFRGRELEARRPDVRPSAPRLGESAQFACDRSLLNIGSDHRSG